MWNGCSGWIKTLIILLGIMSLSSAAHAGLIQVNFTATVTGFHGPDVGVSIGDPISGAVFYDPTVSDSNPDPTRGDYDQSFIPGARAILTSGSFFTEVPLDYISVAVFPSSHELANFVARTEDEDGNFTRLFALLMRRDPSLFESDAMPRDLSLQDYAVGELGYDAPIDDISLLAGLNSLETVSQVPLPPTVWLFLSALLGLLPLSRKWSRSPVPESS